MSFPHVIAACDEINVNVREPLTLAASERQRSSSRTRGNVVSSLAFVGFLFVFYFHPSVTQSPIVSLAAETNDDDSFGSLQQETRPFSNECTPIAFVHIFASKQPPFGSETERARSEKNSLCECESCFFFFLVFSLTNAGEAACSASRRCAQHML